jgi:hypothetical protein
LLDKILEEGLAALVPAYDGGNVTHILKADGARVTDPRTCKTVLRNIARLYGVDLAATRRKYREVVNKRQQVPIPFTTSLVLIPIKMRKSPLGENDGTLGYVNFRQVESIEENKRGCEIVLKSGHRVKPLVSYATVLEYMKNARIVEKTYMEQHLPGTVLERGPVYRPLEVPWEVGREMEDLQREYFIELLLEILRLNREKKRKVSSHERS